MESYTLKPPSALSFHVVLYHTTTSCYQIGWLTTKSLKSNIGLVYHPTWGLTFIHELSGKVAGADDRTCIMWRRTQK
jgi:hypothetical protein